ncbi:MAG: hypothetical protein EOM19_04255 [Candidatus Moranbacteria bacterium]|nr:hypothetical protein [Candidatus Moranbacteria bacterium]
MNKLQEISSQPDYDSKASSFSKLIIATFFISYVYMILTISSKTGWIGLAIFLFAGLFISSIVIAMPFFILKRVFPKISIIIVILSIFTTFFVTKAVFNWVFNEPKAPNATISVLPEKFSDDEKMFKESLTKFGEASDMTNSPERNATDEQTAKVLSLTLESVEDSKKVSDEFLDYLHKDLKYNYREKFSKSQQLYYEGLSQSKDTDTIESESVKKQIEAGKLMNEWLNWWKSNDKEIIDKIF